MLASIAIWIFRGALALLKVLHAHHTDAQQRIGAQLQQVKDQLATAQDENEKLAVVVSAGNNIDGMSDDEVTAELKRRGELRDDLGGQASGVHDVQGVQGKS